MGARHGDTAELHGFTVRLWSNLCICSPGVVELVKSNLAPDFPLFHGLNSVLNVEALVGAGEYPFRGLLRNCEYFAKFRCKLYQRHVTWPHLSSRGTSGKCDRESAFKYIL